MQLERKRETAILSNEGSPNVCTFRLKLEFDFFLNASFKEKAMEKHY
jgi:hypothetical protein